LTIIAGFIGAVYYLAWRTWNSIRRKVSDIGVRQTDKGAFLIGGSFALAAALLHCVVDFDMHVPADALLAVSIMGLLVAHGRYLTERYWKNPGNVGKVALVLGAVAVIIYLGATGIKLGREQHWVEVADAAERVLNRRIDPNARDLEAAIGSPARREAFATRLAALRKAYEADPTDAFVCFRLGEGYWDMASQGDRGYQGDTLEAMRWYSRALLNNSIYAQAWLQYGICLDWLDRHQDASFYFDRALELDPNGWYPAFCAAKHLVELNELAKAKEMFWTAYRRSDGSLMIWEYMQTVDRRMAEGGK